MHDYTKRTPVHSNVSALQGYPYYDIDTILSSLRNDNVQNQFLIKDSEYELFIYLTKFCNHSRSFMINVELYDAEYNEVEIIEALELFESRSEFRYFIENSINTYLDDINNLQLKVHYFDEFDGAYDVKNNKFYAAIYDFKTNTFLPIPEAKEVIIKFEEPNIDMLMNHIYKQQ